MTEYIVAVDRITYYSILAENEEDAIDLVLEGEGEEVNQETIDATISSVS